MQLMQSMEGKSQVEQEKDIRELLRRADRYPGRNSNQRKDALKRLIELARSQFPNLKVIAATNLKNFIKDFPELEDDAINAVYDLCEDPVTQVRIKGYAAIVDVSKEQNKWVKRNADVLVQLLQSDEPEEVIVVKRALTQHLDMDPAVTLGVLCDQIVPLDEPMDDEERAIRDRLRSLVLTFITGEAKRAIIERHTSAPGSAAEEVLVSGLLKAVAQLTTQTDLELIVKDILLSMQSFKKLSPRGKQLLDAILDRAQTCLKLDLQPGAHQASLEHTRQYLNLAYCITAEHRAAHPSHLLRFYLSNLTPKTTMRKLASDAQVFVISGVANSLAACEEGDVGSDPAETAENAQLRKLAVDSSAVLFEIFADLTLAQRRPWDAIRLLLQACARRHKETASSIPTNLWASIDGVRAVARAQLPGSVDNMEEIHALLRSLLQEQVKPAPTPAPLAATDTTTGKGMAGESPTAAAKGERRIMNISSKRKMDVALPPRPTTPRATPASTSAPQLPNRIRATPPHTQARVRSATIPGNANNNSHDTTTDEPRAAKRAKNGGEDDDPPSLLSRMMGVRSAPAANGNANGKLAERVPHKIPPKPRMLDDGPITFLRQPRAPPPDLNTPPAGGYSIKGAAKATERASPMDTPHSSLLDRLQSPDEWEGRKKRRTKI